MLPMRLARRLSRRAARSLTTRRGVAKNPRSRSSASTATGTATFEVDREELGRFDLRRAGLPNMSVESAAKYIDEHRASRPWLAMTDRASPEARRIIAAMDAAGGHAHIRHEGWVTEEANRRRVTHREDPAQLDPEKRELSIDGLRPNDKRHRCAGHRYPDHRSGCLRYRVRPWRRASQSPGGAGHGVQSGRANPRQVAIPIADLLGPDGHGHCTGWRLEPVDGSMETAYGSGTTGS